MDRDLGGQRLKGSFCCHVEDPEAVVIGTHSGQHQNEEITRTLIYVKFVNK